MLYATDAKHKRWFVYLFECEKHLNIVRQIILNAVRDLAQKFGENREKEVCNILAGWKSSKPIERQAEKHCPSTSTKFTAWVMCMVNWLR